MVTGAPLVSDTAEFDTEPVGVALYGISPHIGSGLSRLRPGNPACSPSSPCLPPRLELMPPTRLSVPVRSAGRGRSDIVRALTHKPRVAIVNLFSRLCRGAGQMCLQRSRRRSRSPWPRAFPMVADEPYPLGCDRD